MPPWVHFIPNGKNNSNFWVQNITNLNNFYLSNIFLFE